MPKEYCKQKNSQEKIFFPQKILAIQNQIVYGE